MLGLPAPGPLARIELPVAVAAVAAVLGLAAAQPFLTTERTRLTRLDAEAFVALDTSRSMLAAGSPNSPARLDRARRIARRLRAALSDTPTGLGTFTDRPLPLLLPSPDTEAFDSALAKAVGIERPPPRSTGVTISSFDAVAPIPIAGYFRPGVTHRLLVIVTDAESETFAVETLRRAFAGPPRTGVVLVRVGSPGEQVFGPTGAPEPAYIPPPAGGEALAGFLEATHGRSFGEREIGGAIRVARAAARNGPSRAPRHRVGTDRPRTVLRARRSAAARRRAAAAKPLDLFTPSPRKGLGVEDAGRQAQQCVHARSGCSSEVSLDGCDDRTGMSQSFSRVGGTHDLGSVLGVVAHDPHVLESGDVLIGVGTPERRACIATARPVQEGLLDASDRSELLPEHGLGPERLDEEAVELPVVRRARVGVAAGAPPVPSG